MKRKGLKILSIISIVAIGIGLLLCKIPRTIEVKDVISKIDPQAAPSAPKGGSLRGADGRTMYYYIPGGYTFCAGYNWQIVRRSEDNSGSDPLVDGGVENAHQEVEYTLDKTTELAQSVAFGKYFANNFGASNEDIQNLIWASNDWLTELGGQTCLAEKYQKTGPYYSGNDNIYERSYKFADFVYNILDDGENLNFDGTPKSDTDDNLRIIVDQDADDPTYIVGPYNIEFPDCDGGVLHGGYNSKADLVWDEITSNHTGKFITGKVSALVSFQNESSYTANIGEIEVLDERGEKIDEGFPHFNKIFYIRYHTSNSAEIVEKIKPKIEINYMKKFSGSSGGSASGGSSGGSSSSGGGIINAYTYKSVKSNSKILEDRTELLRKEMFGFGCGKTYLGRYPWCYSWPGFTGDSIGKRVIQLNERDGTSYGRTFSLVRDSTTVLPLTTSGLEPALITDLERHLKAVYASLGWSGTDVSFIDWDIEIGHIITNTTSGGESHELQGWYPDVDSINLVFSSEGGESQGYYVKDSSGNDIGGPYSSDSEAWEEAGSLGHVEEKFNNYILKATVVTSGDSPINGKVYTYEVSHSTFQANSNACWQTLLDKVNDYFRLHVYLGFEINDFTVVEVTDKFQPAVVIDKPVLRKTNPTEDGKEIPGSGTPSGSGEKRILGCKEFNMYYSGNVWQDMPTTTIGDVSAHGQRTNRSLSMAGIQVELWDNTFNHIVARTTTNSSGNYSFQKLNPLHKYRAVFTYDGMRFQSSEYHNNLSGGFSTAQENVYNVSISRGNFNDRFDRIESSPQNYWNESGWFGNSRKAYGLYTKLERSDGSYIHYEGNSGINAGSLRYYDALQIFKELATNGDLFDSTSEATMTNGSDGRKPYYRIGTGIDGHCNYYEQINFGYSDIEGDFKSRLSGLEVDGTEVDRVWTFIMDTLIQSSTNPYPEENHFVLEDVDHPSYGNVLDREYLYTPTRDQSRNVDFGLMLRYNLDLWLSKDVYKATVLVNGKQETYYYNTKNTSGDSAGDWYTNDAGTYEFSAGSDAQNRAGNSQYNGDDKYQREIRKSEYLYDGSDAGTSDTKNLQVYVTYKIAIKNQSQAIWASVDEVVDYYDEAQYYTPVDMPNNTIIKENTYVGDAAGNKVYMLNAAENPLNVSDKSTYISKYAGNDDYQKDISYNQNTYNINGVCGYKAIYLTGIRSVGDGNKDNKGNSILGPGETTYVYVTFKVKNDNTEQQKVLIDQNLDDLIQGREEIRLSVGKRNIAEINGYSTYYDGTGTKAGVIDVDSNPGSFKGYVDGNGNSHSPDLNVDKNSDRYGDLKSSSNSWENRLEDDGDKSKNLQLVIPTTPPPPPGTPPTPGTDNNDITRSIAGYVYEDARTEVSDGAVIGNGVYNESDNDVFEENNDKKINGVTVQLVELMPKVDDEGFPTGVYEKEKIWSTVDYVMNGNSWTPAIDETRYYSGTALSRVILTGPGVFKVNPTTIPEGEGVYKYESLPPGDFFIRFIYGDTTQTVLTNVSDGTDSVQATLDKLTDDQKNNFVAGAGNSGILGTSGLNSKSYTGQDYKSTIYQKNVNQNPEVNYHSGIIEYATKNVENYDKIIGYVNTSIQNYNRENVNDKRAMYNYSIALSDKNAAAVNRSWNPLGFNVGEGISDAKDVFSYREDERSYSLGSKSPLSENLQTLKNHRAEVLASGTQLVTRAEALIEEDKLEEAVTLQREALKELVDNTKMVAQTGIINTEVEYNRRETGYGQDLSYKVEDVDLGLTERPRAQLLLSKELTNIQVRLANGQILFDTNQSVNNLYYGKHKVFDLDEYYYNAGTDANPGYRLRRLLAQKEKDRKEELISVSMDEELMVGATVRLSYRVTVDNIGEVDYLDTDFYYLGKTITTNWDNVSKTNARTIIDYVTNAANYEVNYQDDVSNWQIITKNTLLQKDADKGYEDLGTYSKENLYIVTEDNDYINSYYEPNLDTYNVLVTTKKLSDELLPRALETDKENMSNSRREVNLILSTLLNNASKDENLVYTNLVEIIETSNSWGRRMELSRAGDQGMPYQSDDKSNDETTTWIKPKGPTSDSAQKVVITVPTGENRDYARAIIIALGSIAIIVGAIIVIKKQILKSDKNIKI